MFPGIRGIITTPGCFREFIKRWTVWNVIKMEYLQVKAQHVLVVIKLIMKRVKIRIIRKLVFQQLVINATRHLILRGLKALPIILFL